MPSAVHGPVPTVPSDDTVVGSASVSGRMIAVAATTSPGTVLHVGSARYAGWEQIEIKASVIGTATRLLTIEWGGTSVSDRIQRYLGAKGGLITVAKGKNYRNLTIRAYADVANEVNCMVAVCDKLKADEP